ncbi:MAG: hypothetical protein IJ809_01605 [Clostridia bacterium]|nr:hypothetical protein [Clostridia bacterium]
MNMKSGITMTVLAVAIAIMLLLLTGSTIIGSGYINDAKFEEYNEMLNAVSSSVNAYVLANKSLPINNEAIIYNNFDVEFGKEVISKGDQYNKLYIVDVTKLGNYTIKEGRGSISNKDVFVVAENTNNVYYLKGYEYKNAKYYGL